MANVRTQSVTLEGVRLLYPNFSGAETPVNTTGKRTFNIILPQDIARDLSAAGWHVKYPEPYEEGDEPDPRLEVTVNFNGRPPHIVLITDRGQTELSKDSVGILDSVVMLNVDVTINPYYWEVGGKSGIRAYLEEIYVTIQESPLQRKYANVPYIRDQRDEHQDD